MPMDEILGRRLRQQVPLDKPLLQQNPEPRALLQRLGNEGKVMLQRAGDYKTPSPRANYHALLNIRGKSSNARDRRRNK